MYASDTIGSGWQPALAENVPFKQSVTIDKWLMEQIEMWLEQFRTIDRKQKCICKFPEEGNMIMNSRQYVQ